MLSKNSRAALAGVVLADTFDKEIDKFYQRGAPGRPLVIDIREASYIEIAALINCIAIFLQRSDAGQVTFLTWPRTQSVRDFLHVWRFPEALEDATGQSITAIFENAEDLQAFIDVQATFTGQGDAVNKLEYDPDWEPRKKTRRNFFEFVTFKETVGQDIQPRGRFASAPRDEGKKWTQPLIHAVLDKYLPGETTKDEVARVIVYESLSNAIRHPGARVIQIVSRLGRRVASRSPAGEVLESAPSVLRICVWDDGTSIANTLLTVLREGGSVHAFHLPPYMCDRVHVTIRNFEQTRQRSRVVDQAEEITHETTEARILLASLFPGVTRSAQREIAKVEPFDEKDASRASDALLSSAPGMGLYALTRTVIDQFFGNLLIRSGGYRLIIEGAHDAYRKQYGVRYKCKVTKYRDQMPAFKGNLLAIQLPLKPPPS